MPPQVPQKEQHIKCNTRHCLASFPRHLHQIPLQENRAEAHPVHLRNHVNNICQRQNTRRKIREVCNLQSSCFGGVFSLDKTWGLIYQFPCMKLILHYQGPEDLFRLPYWPCAGNGQGWIQHCPYASGKRFCVGFRIIPFPATASTALKGSLTFRSDISDDMVVGEEAGRNYFITLWNSLQ